MKRILIIAAVATVSFAGCIKNEVNVVENTSQITFNPAAAKVSTKIIHDGTAYPTDEMANFATYAYHVNGSTTTPFINQPGYSYGAEVSFNATESYWSTATPYYWPATGSLTILSYSPYKYQAVGGNIIGSDADTDCDIIADANGIQFLNYNCAAHQATDLMVADAVTGLTGNTQQIGTWKIGVPTVFHHKLSQIVAVNFETVDNSGNVFDFAYGHDDTPGNEYKAGDIEFVVKEVVFKNLYGAGDYTYSIDPATDEWTNQDSARDAQWITGGTTPFSDGKFNTDRQASTTYKYLLIIPQTFHDDAAILITYDKINYLADGSLNGTLDGKPDTKKETITKSTPLSTIHANEGGKLLMNKKVTYTVKISTDNRIYWAPSIIGWEDCMDHTFQL